MSDDRAESISWGDLEKLWVAEICIAENQSHVWHVTTLGDSIRTNIRTAARGVPTQWSIIHMANSQDEIDIFCDRYDADVKAMPEGEGA